MIGIAAVFLLIGYMEWIYLNRDRQKPSTIRIVMGLDILLMLCSEAVYLTRNSQLTVGMILNAVFAPVQQMLFAGT
jgi:hypothetical protein